jgi:hypothetical protein
LVGDTKKQAFFLIRGKKRDIDIPSIASIESHISFLYPIGIPSPKKSFLPRLPPGRSANHSSIRGPISSRSPVRSLQAWRSWKKLEAGDFHGKISRENHGISWDYHGKYIGNSTKKNPALNMIAPLYNGENHHKPMDLGILYSSPSGRQKICGILEI